MSLFNGTREDRGPLIAREQAQVTPSIKKALSSGDYLIEFEYYSYHGGPRLQQIPCPNYPIELAITPINTLMQLLPTPEEVCTASIIQSSLTHPLGMPKR